MVTIMQKWIVGGIVAIRLVLQLPPFFLKINGNENYLVAKDIGITAITPAMCISSTTTIKILN